MVTLEVTIPTEHQDRVLEALTKYSGWLIHMKIQHMELGNISDNDVGWKYEQEGTPKAFGEKVLREFLIAMVRCHEYAEDKDRYADEQEALTPPGTDIPEDLVT